jgi:hypothetical protein
MGPSKEAIKYARECYGPEFGAGYFVAERDLAALHYQDGVDAGRAAERDRLRSEIQRRINLADKHTFPPVHAEHELADLRQWLDFTAAKQGDRE